MKHLNEGLIKQRGVTKIVKSSIDDIKDIQDGDIVVLENGKPYMKYQNTMQVRYYGLAKVSLNEYRKDLTHVLYKYLNIMKIYRPSKSFDPKMVRPVDVLERIIHNADTKLIYDRENQ